MSEEKVGQDTQLEETTTVSDQETAATTQERPAPEQSEADARPSDVEDLKAGMRLKGKVRNIVDFGAFIDVGVGRDGLAHISTLRRAGIDKTLKVGDVIDVQIRRVDLDRNRISLTIPGAGRSDKKPLKELKVGDVVDGRIVRLVDFGAFVDIGAQTDGLLHISEMPWGYVNHPREVLEPAQEVQVRILDVDTDRRRISLSMKDLEGEVEAPRQQPEPEEDRGPGTFAVAWQEALKDLHSREE